MQTDKLKHCPTNKRSSTWHTTLLVSVREPDEVEAAISGGADWIDLKEPKAGPLGPVSVDIARQIIQRVEGRRPISAALGELKEWNDSPVRGLLDFPEIEVVKLGLAGCAQLHNWQALWVAAAETVSASGHELAAVAYADWHQAEAPSPEEIIACAAAAGGRYFLLDTFDKKAGGVFKHISASQLNDILGLAKEASLHTVVAGSIQKADLPALSSLEVDTIGVRGSACGGDRTSPIDPMLVADFRAAMLREGLGE